MVSSQPIKVTRDDITPITAAAISRYKIMTVPELIDLNVPDTLTVTEDTLMKDIVHRRDRTTEAKVNLVTDMIDRAGSIGTG